MGVDKTKRKRRREKNNFEINRKGITKTEDK